ncbi:hypothetical protein [Aliiroseovarius sp. F20344]|uniref:hypothetical protein n=1 Tax=Aliiroseovarius sp. F20344 TaxID=2926414 RepID=UPI001FF2EBB1|nr:hypothetical protein [Aliiroseovarius sp. F20344]MCK0143143.1 hypothetical protein [Aliiroseovarius sp. F20344]
MKIAIHIGAHCTDEDQLTKSLLKNANKLFIKGVAVPGPTRYRGLLGQIMTKLNGSVANSNTQDMLIDELIDSKQAERIVMGHQHSLGTHQQAIEGGRLYPLAGHNSAGLRKLFPSHDVSYYIGISNIANFMPDVAARLDDKTRAQMLETTNPLELYWADVIESIRQANPDTPITVWCNEDTPLIWPEIMHAISGLDDDTQLDRGDLDILEQITKEDGMTRLRNYLFDNPFQNEVHRRRILAAFLDKFAKDGVVEREIDLPGWTQGLVDELTENYEEDLKDISGIEGVTLLSP